MADRVPNSKKPKEAAAVERPKRPQAGGGALNTGPKKKDPPKEIPNAPQPGRPGHNGGGWLRSGNTDNVGRKPSAVRASILQTVDEAAAVMRSILDGEFKVELRDMFGNLTGYRSATIKETIAAFDSLAKHALPVKSEVSGPDGGPIPVENREADLSGLTVSEKEALLQMLEKLEAAAPKP